MIRPWVVERAAGDRGLGSWIEEHSRELEMRLTTSGAVLFRGFQVADAQEFRTAMGPVLAPLMDYIEGASPRTAVGEGVYTSTEYAADQPIALHNELSYASRWPGRVAFYCLTPATSGGRTPIADSRAVYARILRTAPGPLPSRIRYLRHMHEGRGPGVGWPTVFASSKREVVEEYCQQADVHCSWMPDGTLRTVQDRPTAVVHPSTGQRVWFNQAHQWHPSNGGPEREDLWRELFGDQLPMDACEPDGSPIDSALLDAIRAAFDAERAAYDWHAGDVLLLDNLLVAHGREPFTGPREVLVAMGRPSGLHEVEAVDTHG